MQEGAEAELPSLTAPNTGSKATKRGKARGRRISSTCEAHETRAAARKAKELATCENTVTNLESIKVTLW